MESLLAFAGSTLLLSALFWLCGVARKRAPLPKPKPPVSFGAEIQQGVVTELRDLEAADRLAAGTAQRYVDAHILLLRAKARHLITGGKP